MDPNRSTLRRGLILFLLALLPRLLFWIEWRRAGILALPVVDALTFDREAVGLVAGTWPGPEPFWQAPLYSFFLGGIYLVAGHSWLAARFAQALLGAGTCVLAWRIGSLFLSTRRALVVFGICALYGPLIAFEGLLLRETLATFLLALSIWRWLASIRRERESRGTQGPGSWFLCGALLGLASICRETCLLLAPIVLVERFSARAIPRRRLAAGVFAAGVLLPILPVTAFNTGREGRILLISSGGGVNFFLGNNARSRQTIAIRPGRHWTDLVDRPRREAGATTAAERSAFFYQEALDWIVRHPASFAANTGRKAISLLAAHEIKRNQDPYEMTGRSRLLKVLLWRAGPFGFPFGLLGPAGFLGLYLALRRKGRDETRALAWAALAFACGVILFFPTARYRLPLVPLLAPLAVLGAAAVRDSFRRGPEPIPPALRMETIGVALLFLLLSNAGWVRQADDPADQAFLRGSSLMEMRRDGEALAELQAATRANPRHGDAWTAMASLHGRSGRIREAMGAALAALAIDPTDATARVNLAMAQLAAGDSTSSERSLREALAGEPDHIDAWVNLGLLLAARGDKAGAIDAFRHALLLEPGHSQASGLLRRLEGATH